MFERLNGKHVLMLQGPVGPFFSWISRAMQKQGATVTKVNFNAADAWYYSEKATVQFKRRRECWRDELLQLLVTRSVDAIVMFGDSRPYHVTAKEVASAQGLPTYFFEEGYLRPDFVTFESSGTNFGSLIPRAPEFFEQQSHQPLSAPPRAVGNTFWHSAWYATIYAVIMSVFSWRYPHYVHHRDWQPVKQAAIWWRSAFRKLIYGVLERRIQRQIFSSITPYFLVPLQVHDDYQVKNSRFKTLEKFLEAIALSFAESAPGDSFLVFKHHPQDRGSRDYSKFLCQLARECNVEDRVYYIHDLHLPTLLKRAKGSVVLNSTVGLSSLLHGTPVKCLDDCVYSACCTKQSLEEFWNKPAPVQAEIVTNFINWTKRHVLLNGSLYQAKFWTPASDGGARNSTLAIADPTPPRSTSS